MSRVRDWAPAVAKRIGAACLDFTPTKVGQTLHVPCSRGHLVDFDISGGMPPEFVAKKMMQKGWTIGSKLVCPEHARKKAKGAVEQNGNWRRPEITTGEKIVAVLAENDNLTVEQISATLKAKNDTVYKALRTLIKNGSVFAYKIAGSPFMHTLTKTQEEPEMNATVTPIITVSPSDEARTARRLATMLIEEKFDVGGGFYRDGYTDKKVADETGVAEHFVTKRREEDFGPMKEPPEIARARNELDALTKRVKELETHCAKVVEGMVSDIAAHRQRLANLILKNGWHS